MFIIFLLVSIVPLIFMSTMLIASFFNQYRDDQQTTMLRQANTIALNLPSNLSRNQTSFYQAIGAFVDGRVLIIDDTGLVLYDTQELAIGRLYGAEEVIRGLLGETLYFENKTEDLSVVITPIWQRESEDVLGVVMMTRSLEDLNASVLYLNSIASLLLVILIILIVALSLYMATMITRPFSRFIRYTKGILDGHIEYKLDLQGNYEVEAITQSFNQMIERLWEVEENRQQFVANVSHELKTPLSSIKVLAESLLTQEGVSLELYREFLEDINNEVDRESKIITDLLTLVTLDQKADALNITKVSINALSEMVLKRLSPLARLKDVDIILESLRPTIAEVDEVKITLVITNLVENGIKYNETGGQVRLIVDSDHKDMILTVKDTGIGIPKDSRDKIFDRFYRVDKTRSRDTGGTGLGLSIVYRTVQMHHGMVTCESEEDKGSTFVVRLPLKYVKDL